MAEARCRPRGPAFESAAAEALKLREEEPRSPALARFWDVLVSKADGNRCQTIFRASPRHKIDGQDIGVFSGAVAPIQRARGVLFCDVPVSSAEIGALNETGSLRGPPHRRAERLCRERPDKASGSANVPYYKLTTLGDSRLVKWGRVGRMNVERNE
jgi:hypothetical protein